MPTAEGRRTTGKALSAAQRVALGVAPFDGFRPGSNAWAYATLAGVDAAGNVCRLVASGEEIDELIRHGLLEAEALPDPHRVVTGPDDFEATISHRYRPTPAGRTALAQG